MKINKSNHQADPLLGGFYTVSEACRLLRIDSKPAVRGWLSGYHNSTTDPVLDRDYKKIGQIHELSFWDMMEVRFINYFHRQGISMQVLRAVAIKTRSELKAQHPFALSKVKFITDRKQIFAQVVEASGDTTTREIINGQYQFYNVIENSLANGVEFDPKTHMAMRWQPLRDSCPNVYVDPRHAFGKPVISDKHIPTSALFKSMKAEGFEKNAVAEWYNVTPDDVEEAVKFEIELGH